MKGKNCRSNFFRKHCCPALSGGGVAEGLFLGSKPVRQASVELEMCLLLLEDSEVRRRFMCKEANVGWGKKGERLSWDQPALPELPGWGLCDCFLWTTCGLWEKERERQLGAILGPLQLTDWEGQRAPNRREKKGWNSRFIGPEGGVTVTTWSREAAACPCASTGERVPAAGTSREAVLVPEGRRVVLLSYQTRVKPPAR